MARRRYNRPNVNLFHFAYALNKPTSNLMTYRLVAATVLLLVSPVLALDGQTGIHDPSTVVMHAGRYVHVRDGGRSAHLGLG